MARVTIVRTGGLGRVVTPMLVSHLPVIVMRHLIHLELPDSLLELGTSLVLFFFFVALVL